MATLLMCAMPVFGATIYLDPATEELKQGDSVTVAVRLDVDEVGGECINAIDGVISYDQGLLPVDSSLGDSIFSLWIEEPTFNTENNTVSFAGGIPNGYCGRIQGDPGTTNVVAEIIFTTDGYSPEPGPDAQPFIAEVTVSEDSIAYLNDGQGTMVRPTTRPASVTISPERGGEKNAWLDEVAADTARPKPFSIHLERDEDGIDFGGKYYIVFNTSDKQTGIDHYEVIEEPSSDLSLFRFGAADAPWITTRSPYVLMDQSLNSTIRVKAVDNAGNEYIATLIPDESLRTTTPVQYLTTGITLLLLVIMIAAPIWLIVRRRQHIKQNRARVTSSATTTVRDNDEIAARKQFGQAEHSDDDSHSQTL